MEATTHVLPAVTVNLERNAGVEVCERGGKDEPLSSNVGYACAVLQRRERGLVLVFGNAVVVLRGVKAVIGVAVGSPGMGLADATAITTALGPI